MRLPEDKVDWVVGFLDECWWSRAAQPNLHSFSEEGAPLRLVEQMVEKDDPDPKAISCYGLYTPELARTWLRFVDGRPVSGITTRFLEWCSKKLEEARRARQKSVGVDLGQRQLAYKPGGQVLDRFSQPRSQKEWSWSEEFVTCLLPKKSPWLNAIEPKWIHGKRKVVEPAGLLGAYELAERVCAAFKCPHYEHLSIAENVA
jgi:hypothetical protein